MKYGIYSVYTKRGKNGLYFPRCSGSKFYKTAEEAIEEMNAHYLPNTKVMEVDKDGTKRVIAYHKYRYHD